MALKGLDSVYRDVILDHRLHPRNYRALEPADITGDGVNPFCGDEAHLQILLDDGGRVSKVGMQGEGCSINRATGSMLTEAVEGKSLPEIERLSAAFRGMMRGEPVAEDERRLLGSLRELEGVREFPVRVKCSLLAWSTLDDAIDDFSSTQGV